MLIPSTTHPRSRGMDETHLDGETWTRPCSVEDFQRSIHAVSCHQQQSPWDHAGSAAFDQDHLDPASHRQKKPKLTQNHQSHYILLLPSVADIAYFSLCSMSYLFLPPLSPTGLQCHCRSILAPVPWCHCPIPDTAWHRLTPLELGMEDAKCWPNAVASCKFPASHPTLIADG